MKVSVLTALKQIEEQERAVPQAGPGEVLIRVKHCGVCGSDVHYYEHGRIGDFIVDYPIILGHECAGEVIETGAGVRNVNEGDIVAVEPGHTCMKCEHCKAGRYNLCEDVVFLATPPYDGAFAEYITYPADMVFKLPSHLDTTEGALIEPLCVGLHAAAQAEARVGQSAVILGSGCIGLCTLMALIAQGITEVYVVDVIQKRLEKACELGAVRAIHGTEENALEVIKELTGGKGADLVFETAGTAVTTQQTAELVKAGGTIVLVGMAANPVFAYDFGTLMGKEAKIHTVFRYRNLYPTAISLVASGKIPIRKIATDYYGFADIDKAMRDSVERKSDIVKAVIHI